ncbi:MAG TPA: HigA family addiction module antitoxin [Longimicrobiales bacterium]
MNPDHAKAFQPDLAVPPGETVLETIAALGITQAELSARTGRPRKTINEIIKGKAAITPETALQFEKVLGIDAAFWNTLEQQYRAALARAAERERMQAMLDWAKTLPVKALIRQKWIPSFKEPVKQLEAVLSFYGVVSPEAWQEVWSDLRRAASYRRARTFESDFATVTAWLRKGELDARGIKTGPYDAKAFRDALAHIRSLTLDPGTGFVHDLVETCAATGVAVCFVPELPKLRISGATRWLTPEKALIQLSLRYKTNDQLWFTFFHEAGHILLHGKRSVFVEEPTAAASTTATGADEALQQAEEEADAFARDLLIPPGDYQSFLSRARFTGPAIRRFAAEIGIHPGIVLGRLQRDGYIPYPTRLNTQFKVRYRFAEP